MTYGYDDHTPIPARSKADRIRVWSIGVSLAVVGVASAIYLTDQYRAAAPWRAAQESERLREREARAEEKARQDAIEADRIAARDAAADAALNPQVPVTSAPAPDFTKMTQAELRRYFEQHRARSGDTPAPAPSRPSPAEPVSGPLEWAVRPQWPPLRDYTFPDGVNRISVQFRCQTSRTGALSGCVATESPQGTGLAARMRPALADARIVPPTSNGIAVAGEASFSIAFAERVAPPALVDRSQPPIDAPAPPSGAQAKPEAPPEPPTGG